MVGKWAGSCQKQAAKHLGAISLPWQSIRMAAGGGGRREKLAQLSARANEMCSPWRGACDVRKDWLKTVSAFEACSVYVSVNIHPEVKRLALDPGSSRVCASEIDRGHKFLPVTVEGEEGLISPKNNII